MAVTHWIWLTNCFGHSTPELAHQKKEKLIIKILTNSPEINSNLVLPHFFFCQLMWQERDKTMKLARVSVSTSQMTGACNRLDQWVRCPPPAVSMDGELNKLHDLEFKTIMACNLTTPLYGTVRKENVRMMKRQLRQARSNFYLPTFFGTLNNMTTIVKFSFVIWHRGDKRGQNRYACL